MSSGFVSLCLLVLVGVVLASGTPCQFVSENLKKSHDSIADVLKLKEAEVNMNPLFTPVIKSINTSCQRKIQVMNATLDVYIRIFSSILQPQQHPGSTPLLDQLSVPEKRAEVEQEVQLLKNKVVELKKRLSHLSHEREDLLSKISRIEVDDPLVQRKALAQFREVFQAASLIGSPRCGHAHTASVE